jgi:hypothetical protein
MSLEAAAVTIRGLLFADVFVHLLQLKAHCGHCVSTGPEVLAREIPLFATQAGHRYGALPLQKSDHGSHRILRRNRDTAKISSAMSERSGANQTPQEGPTSDAQKKTEDDFKNIQVLKGVPSDQLIPAMQFMSSSLGVECSFCHVEGHFEKDDKKTKQTARNMMLMMFALNRNSFEGHHAVTCYSCHRGMRNPAATPIVGRQAAC